MQHAAGDRRAGGAQGGEPQSAGEPAGADGKPAGVGERQRGAGEERHHPPVAGEDRAGAERGAGTTGATVTPDIESVFTVDCTGGG